MSHIAGGACKIIAIGGYKGGIGKSTTAVDLADELAADFNYKVLLIDADPQGDCTKHIWATMPDELAMQDPMFLTPTLNELLTDATIDIGDVIYTNAYGLDLIPANQSLDQTDSSITAPQVRNLLVDIIKELAPQYDFIIVDTRRSGSRLTLSVFRIADQILLPMQAEYLSLENIGPTILDIEQIKKINQQVEVLGILPTMTATTKVSKEVKKEVMEAVVKVEERMSISVGTYSNRILPIEIKRSIRHSEASGARLPIRLYIKALTGGWNETRQQKEQENVRGYYQLAEMVAFDVPQSLYLPENVQAYQEFLAQAQAQAS